MADLSCTLLILGAGPGGYVCALRAGQRGVDTIVVERAAAGGTCLNVGCIPSKALIHAGDRFHDLRQAGEVASPLGITASSVRVDLGQTMAWKDGIVRQLTGGVDGLLRKASVRRLQGRASLVDGKTVRVETGDGPVTVVCQHLVIATGAEPVPLPALPFGGPILSSTEALALTAVPASLAVIGGGYIGLEIGTAYAKLGARVTVIEARDQILPQYDADLVKPIAARMAALGMTVRLNTMAEGYDPASRQLSLRSGEDRSVVEADKLLVTVGRRPVLESLGVARLGLAMTGPYLKVDGSGRTSMRGVYAIGDVTGEPMLAHRAMAQGAIVADAIAGIASEWQARAIPAVCFTDPELVVVGLLPAAARAAGHDAASTVYPLRANGRALTLERSDGFLRIVHDRSSGLVLGLQAVGAGVAELAGEFALALEMCATLTDLAATIHAHPTLGEMVQEAALAGLGQGLHA